MAQLLNTEILDHWTIVCVCSVLSYRYVVYHNKYHYHVQGMVMGLTVSAGAFARAVSPIWCKLNIVYPVDHNICLVCIYVHEQSHV